MGVAQSMSTKWVEIAVPLMLNGAQAFDTYKTGKQTRKLMKETEPIIRANANAITSYIGHRQITDRLGVYVSGLGVAVQFLQVWQGANAQSALEEIGGRIAGNAEAQTGLDVPKIFAKQVHQFIFQQTTQEWPSKHRLHVFFLYHPDTDWDPPFFKRTKEQPLSHRFLGMSQNLDALVIWMRFVKKCMAKQGTKIHIHLLIPAYRPILIREALAFPDELMPLTIHGHIHNSKPYVWLNLPSPSRRLRLIDIGNLAGLQSDGSSVTDHVVFKVIAMLTAGAAGGMVAGPPGAFLGAFSAVGGMSQSGQRFSISDADPRTLGEAPPEDSEDGGSSDDDEEKSARQYEPDSRRYRRRQRYQDVPPGY